MNFQFSVNETFPGTHCILKIGHDLLPEEFNTFNSRNLHQVQQRVDEILDRMGQASAKAQDLKAPITSGSKLRMQSEHSVYLLLDRASNNGCGSVVGLLKVGKKNLFLIDGNGEFHPAYRHGHPNLEF